MLIGRPVQCSLQSHAIPDSHHMGPSFSFPFPPPPSPPRRLVKLYDAAPTASPRDGSSPLYDSAAKRHSLPRVAGASSNSTYSAEGAEDHLDGDSVPATRRLSEDESDSGQIPDRRLSENTLRALEFMAANRQQSEPVQQPDVTRRPVAAPRISPRTSLISCKHKLLFFHPDSFLERERKERAVRRKCYEREKFALNGFARQ